jgi:hypothetical protein
MINLIHLVWRNNTFILVKSNSVLIWFRWDFNNGLLTGRGCVNAIRNNPCRCVNNQIFRLHTTFLYTPDDGFLLWCVIWSWFAFRKNTTQETFYSLKCETSFLGPFSFVRHLVLIFFFLLNRTVWLWRAKLLGSAVLPPEWWQLTPGVFYGLSWVNIFTWTVKILW